MMRFGLIEHAFANRVARWAILGKPTASQPGRFNFGHSILEKRARRTLPTSSSVLAVGDWVTLKAESRRSIDVNKSTAKCFITSIDGDSAKVLYPNNLSLFLHMSDESVMLRARTETCSLSRARLVDKAEVPRLDRTMVKLLAQALTATKETMVCEPASAKGSAASKTALTKNQMLLLTTCVSRAFGERTVMAKDELKKALTETFSEEEIRIGLVALDSLNKIFIADDSVIRV